MLLLSDKGREANRNKENEESNWRRLLQFAEIHVALGLIYVKGASTSDGQLRQFGADHICANGRIIVL